MTERWPLSLKCRRGSDERVGDVRRFHPAGAAAAGRLERDVGHGRAARRERAHAGRRRADEVRVDGADNVPVERSGDAPDADAGPAGRAAALAVVLEVLGLVRAQRRRARDRRRLVLASADDGARWVCVLDSDGLLGDKRMTRAVARFSWCSSGRWPAGVVTLPGDTPALAMRAGVDVLMLRYGPQGARSVEFEGPEVAGHVKQGPCRASCEDGFWRTS